ncbi:MAG: DUF1343 domain-containing protein [Bacteroidota bacterium]
MVVANDSSRLKENEAQKISVGAANTELYLPKIKDKNIALVVNQTSMIGNSHLVDSLLKLNISIKKIFAPEHGFRGHADAGEKVKDGIDVQTNLPIVSLYGKKKKPLPEDLIDIDLIVFDIQDVGARFYTYISSMSYLMEACAELDIPLLILDRPNPNGHYVDGPVLKKGFESFVGLHPVPVVHGMTVGEYAQMVNGEGWLKDGIKCALEIIKCNNYDHTKFYELPIKPSPNLPNMRSIYLYPSICFFEGTQVSVGRGTDKQFQVLGAPEHPDGNFEFTPVSMPGAKYPKHENKMCRGYDLTEIDLSKLKSLPQLNLNYLIDFYQNYKNKNRFFNENLFFDKLAGNDELRKQLIAGKSENEIRESWQKALNTFKKTRNKYLLYKDFPTNN